MSALLAKRPSPYGTGAGILLGCKKSTPADPALALRYWGWNPVTHGKTRCRH